MSLVYLALFFTFGRKKISTMKNHIKKIYLQQLPLIVFQKYAPNISYLYRLWHCKIAESKERTQMGKAVFWGKRTAGLFGASYFYQKLFLMKTAYREERCIWLILIAALFARRTPTGGILCGRDGMAHKKVLKNQRHERKHFIWKQMAMFCMVWRIVFWLRH